MSYYIVVSAIVLSALLIAAIAVLRRISARLNADIRTLQLSPTRLRSSTRLAASAPFTVDWQSSESSFQSSPFDQELQWHPLDAPYRSFTDETLINPASGLPMVGGVDLAGNFYGFNSTIGFDAASLFDPAASFEYGCSTFETGSSFESPSSFD